MIVSRVNVYILMKTILTIASLPFVFFLVFFMLPRFIVSLIDYHSNFAIFVLLVTCSSILGILYYFYEKYIKEIKNEL
jgi:hypothetical protein